MFGSKLVSMETNCVEVWILTMSNITSPRLNGSRHVREVEK